MTAAPTGKYLDRLTGFVSNYNATTKTLTPTLETASEEVYICIDAYTTTSACAATAGQGQCPNNLACQMNCDGFQACGAVVAAITGSHLLEVKYTTFRPCAAPVVTEDDNRDDIGPGNPVAYMRTTGRISGSCGPGTYVVEFFINGNFYDSREIAYE